MLKGLSISEIHLLVYVFMVVIDIQLTEKSKFINSDKKKCYKCGNAIGISEKFISGDDIWYLQQFFRH